MTKGRGIAGVKVSIRPMDKYEVQDAARTVAAAREHLANPKMVAALKKHAAGLSAALSGPMKPKKIGK